MKARNFAPLFFAAIVVSAVTTALLAADAESQATPQKNAATDTSESMNAATIKALSREELRTLVQLSSLSPEKLASLRRSIEHLEKMSPEEKAQLRKNLEELRSANDKDREKFVGEAREREGRANNNILLRYWRSMPPEKAKEEQEKFKKMDVSARRTYVMEIREKMPQRPSPHGPQPQHPQDSRDNNEREQNRPDGRRGSNFPDQPPRPDKKTTAPSKEAA